MGDPTWLPALRQLFEAEDVLDDPADCWTYGYDNSRQHCAPQAVVFPREAKQIEELVRLCRTHRVALTTRGLGTNTTGASVPLQHGIVLSTERMNRLLEIDPQEQTARAQPGLINQHLQEAATEHQLFWAPDPSSSPFCTIGGNLACNAAGPRALKYGTCRDNVLQVHAITGSGETLVAGTRTRKGVVGLDLLRLLIGSEGTLAIFTEALLLLRPRPQSFATARACYAQPHEAMQAINALLAQPCVPCALEFMDAACLDLIREEGTVDLPAQAQALLLIEMDGTSEELSVAATSITQAATAGPCLDFQTSTEREARETLWQARRTLSPALRRIAPEKINEDVVVPVGQLGNLLAELEQLRQRHSVPIVCFGHAGSGNIHVNLLPDSSDTQRAAARTCLDAIFDAVLRLGGTLSGEHGVGIAKRDHIARELDTTALRLMHAIKRDFDPDGILNPEKSLPNL